MKSSPFDFLGSLHEIGIDCKLFDSETGDNLLDKEGVHIQFVDAKDGYYVALDDEMNLSVTKNLNLILTKIRWKQNGEREVISVYDAKIERQKQREYVETSFKSCPSLTMVDLWKIHKGSEKDKSFINGGLIPRSDKPIEITPIIYSGE